DPANYLVLPTRVRSFGRSHCHVIATTHGGCRRIQEPNCTLNRGSHACVTGSDQMVSPALFSIGKTSRRFHPRTTWVPTGPRHLAPLWRTRFGKLTQHGPTHLLPITWTECSCSMMRTRHSSARLHPQPVWTDFARYGQTSRSEE